MLPMNAGNVIQCSDNILITRNVRWLGSTVFIFLYHFLQFIFQFKEAGISSGQIKEAERIRCHVNAVFSWIFR